MPRGDGTGPQGMGSMTGRGLGYCAGYDIPGYANQAYFGKGPGIGRGVGRGRGFGMDSMYNPRGQLRPRFIGSGIGIMPIRYAENPYQPPTREQELAILNSDKKGIKDQLSGIEKRIKELSK